MYVDYGCSIAVMEDNWDWAPKICLLQKRTRNLYVGSRFLVVVVVLGSRFILHSTTK